VQKGGLCKAAILTLCSADCVTSGRFSHGSQDLITMKSFLWIVFRRLFPHSSDGYWSSGGTCTKQKTKVL